MDIELAKTRSDNVFIFVAQDGSKRLATKALVPGARDEKTITIGNIEYRIWDPYHSKLAAIILKGSIISIKKNASVLYLGAANGTTVSFVSDIVSGGTVFAVEFSPRAMHDLVRVSSPRMNLIPILADAKQPGSYKNMVTEVDFIYQDVAQREQALIAMRNAKMFLKKDGFFVLMIKSRSIDSVKKTGEVTDREVKKLRESLNIKQIISLEPFHSDHTAVVAQKVF